MTDVSGVSKLLFQCGSRDAKFCVSTSGLDKLIYIECFECYWCYRGAAVPRLYDLIKLHSDAHSTLRPSREWQLRSHQHGNRLFGLAVYK